MTTDYPVGEALADAIRWAEAGAPYPPGARGWRPAIGVLAAEVQRMQALTQWQPITTAPKGERVLVYNPLNGRMDIVNGWEDKSIFATHWMPIPEPPSEAGSA